MSSLRSVGVTHALKRAERKENARVGIFSEAPDCRAETTNVCTDEQVE